jgi:hypothetical protein
LIAIIAIYVSIIAIAFATIIAWNAIIAIESYIIFLLIN